MARIVLELASGWVALPVLNALKRKGVLNALLQQPEDLSGLVQRFDANTRCLRAALEVLLELGYIDRPHQNAYSANAHTLTALSLPSELDALAGLPSLSIEMTGEHSAVWEARLARCSVGGNEDQSVASLWDAAILAPMLAGLNSLALDALEYDAPSGFSESLWQAVRRLFVRRGWGVQQVTEFTLTVPGRKVLVGSNTLASVVAHADTFQRLSVLLFDPPSSPPSNVVSTSEDDVLPGQSWDGVPAYRQLISALTAQAWIEPAAWVMDAAATGQFAEPGTWRSMRHTLTGARPDLPRLVSQLYTVRHPVMDDLPQLVELDQLSQPSGLHTPAQILEWRVLNTPQTLMVLEVQGRIAAALHAQRIDCVKALRSTPYADVGQLHQADGLHVQLLGLYVLPVMAGRGYSDALVECMLMYGAALGDVQSVVGVTRCADFVHHRETQSLERYIRSRNDSGEMTDPMLHFHVSRGAIIREVLPGFRPGDIDNEGAGILIEYDLHAVRGAQAQQPDIPVQEPTPSASSVEGIVQSAAINVLGDEHAGAYGSHIPWMEMGFGSLQLLQLRRQLSAEIGLPLDATFFFSYSTPAAAIRYFVEHASEVGEPVSQGRDSSAGGDEAIAIVGMACRLPGGIRNPEQLWQTLMEGRDPVGYMPADRRALRLPGAPDFSWQAGFLSDIDRFDAGFFRISPHEAQWLDPQQRLLMEVAWEALESAGIPPSALRGLANGIFVGLMGSDYANLLGQGGPAGVEAHFGTGSACSVAAGRLAYFLDWRGPAITVDTACSSSLVAVHLACRSLQNFESNIALAAGANVLLDDRLFQAFENAGMLSPTGRCHTFDEAADGYVRAEGCAVVVLKRLSDALADGDIILATIRGSAINQDGGGAGLTAPNPQAQQAVIEAALLKAGVEASSIAYLEAHGTGTPLGDPIEVQAAAQVLGRERSLADPLLIGSIKSVLGHLEAAAGIAGLIKTVLCMKHSIITGQLHYQRPNAHILWDTLPIRVANNPRPWPAKVKRAGISSFGFSGTNAHAILQAHDDIRSTALHGGEPVAIVLSARTLEQLKARIRALLAFLDQAPVDVLALAYTLQTGRDAMAVRMGFIASTLTDVKARLGAYGIEPFGNQAAGTPVLSALDQYLGRWLGGGEVDWHALHDGAQMPKRLALPTYPFADEHYWLPAGTMPIVSATRGTDQLLTLVGHWERADEPAAGAVDSALRTLWLSVEATPSGMPSKATALMFEASCRVDMLIEQLREQPAWDQLIWRVPVTETEAALMGLRLIQALLALGYGKQPLHLTVLTSQAHALETHEQVDPYQASVVGLMGSLAKEYPHWQVRLLDMPADSSASFNRWEQRGADLHDHPQLWRNGAWYRHSLVPTLLPTVAVSAYRQGGVYVLLGGAGGVGVVLSEYLIQRYQAQVVWLGRRAEETLVKGLRTRLGKLGPEPLYLQVDAQDHDALVRAHGLIRERFGVIHGVVHTAMVLADSPLAHMDEDRFMAVLNAKMTVLNLDAVFGCETLDFFAFFSSITSYLKTPGASNYVAGCCFVDAYAHNLNRRAYPVKVMQWGYWGETGGVSSSSYLDFMQQLGLGSLQPAEAMAALEQLLSCPLDQVVFARATKDSVIRLLGVESTAAMLEPSTMPFSQAPLSGRGYRAQLQGLSLMQSVVWDLVDHASEILKLPHQAIIPGANLTEYGFDSILLMRFARRLSEHYELTLWPPLFFSYPNLEQFASYLIQFHEPLLTSFYQPPSNSEPSSQEVVTPQADAICQRESLAESPDDAIAIIGISGRFAGARTADELWAILHQGRSVVQPFAPDRLADNTRQRWLAAMPGVGEFDPLFFEIAPREAPSIDPRQRLLLQETWKALEDAAYGPSQLRQQTISTFVGVEAGDYGRLIGEQNTLTSNHDSILAARLAYFLDFEGPTLAINTACSSGLVALHQGCLSLRSAESDTSIVAAVNLLAGTQLTDQMAQAGMLANDGVCHAFDKRAHGMAPGEAVVVVVLKRLSRALADGDPIRAVIVGSGINGDGKTQGITAPNGRAQSRLFQQIYERYKINPDHIDYVVTHGTGTPLGDPVEINALCQAFAPFTQRRQYCAITSNKPNVGHGLSAAGLVSVVNMIKALEFETIPQSLHCEQQSDYVAWSDSPFFVNRANKPWPANAQRPRLGAVSAFGMSGTNAHVVFRGPETLKTIKVAVSTTPVLLVLSAKTQTALRERIKDLISALLSNPELGSNLQAVSHTLLSGRQHFSWRCAMVVEDHEGAISSLGLALQGEQSVSVSHGQVARAFEAQPATIEEGQRLLKSMSEGLAPEPLKRLLTRLAHLFCEGYELAWTTLYGEPGAPRLHLPTYPFDRENFWAVNLTQSVGATQDASPSVLPSGEPELTNQQPWRYSIKLAGNEVFLRDHVVQGQHIVPGVVQLEWALVAVKLYLKRDVALRLEQVTWLRPLVIESAREVHIVLVHSDDGQIGYEVCCDEPDEMRVYSQGRAFELSVQSVAPRIELSDLQALCTHTLEANTCYRRFAEAGLHYGSSFEVVTEILQGEHLALGTLQALADVSTADGVLTAALLDGALQVSAALTPTAAVAMPFALETFEQWGKLIPSMRVVVRHAQDSSAAVTKFDIDLVDGAGYVVVRFTGYSSRCALPSKDAGAENMHGLMLASSWEREMQTGTDSPSALQRVIQVGGVAQTVPMVSWSSDEGSDILVELLAPHLPLEHVLWYVPVGASQLALMGLRLFKALLALGYAGESLDLTVVTQQAQWLNMHDEVDPEHASVHGLIGSMAKENPLWHVRLLDMAKGEALEQGALLKQPAEPYGNPRLWRQAGWYRHQLVPCELSSLVEGTLPLYREGGVYVVLGGAGGIGVVFSEYLIRRYRAQLIWLGRRVPDESIRQQCARLGALGPMPFYLQADGTDYDALELAQAQIKDRFGVIHGVVHAAIVLADQSLASMEESGFVAALAAKTLTAQNLEAVFGNPGLDFLVFFGSLQSFLKAPGQSNYAAGCCFIDAFAQALKTRPCPPPYPVKVMQWGYWGSVGVVASPFYLNRMARIGLGSIEPAPAMDALEKLLVAPVSHLVFLKTSSAPLAPELGVKSSAEIDSTPSQQHLSPRGDVLTPLPCALVEQAHKDLECRLAQMIWSRLGALGSQGQYSAVAPQYQRWCHAAERVLGNARMHRPAGSLPWETLWQQWQTYCELLPEETGLRAHVRVATEVLQALPAVLSGQQSATAVLFPQGQLHLLEGVYGGHPVADYFNALLGERLQAYVRARLTQDPHAKLRILEVGAGTGATSASLLTLLSSFESHIAEYCYTDVSRIFLAHAQTRYSSFAPYLRTQLLNIEDSPLTQGFSSGQYDVVVAANVLHATRDIRCTVRHVKTLIKGNGLLLLNELSGTSIFQHLVFGLLEGWWLAEDLPLRIADSPALHASTWREVLTGEGFTDIHMSTPHSSTLGQQIFEASYKPLIPSEELAQQASVTGSRILTSNPAAPQEERRAMQSNTHQIIRECVAQSLGLKDDQLHDDQTFVSLGLDSISSVALVTVINTRLGLKLAATVLFDYPTIERFDSYIKNTVKPQLAAIPESPPTQPQAVKQEKQPVMEKSDLQGSTCWRVLLERPGTVDDLRVIEAPCAVLGEYDVRIAVQAFSLNFGDLLCVKGLYPTQPAYPFTPGYEASGTVTAIGSGVSGINVGDAVVALAGEQFGAQSSVITCSQNLVFPCPPGLSFEAACAVPAAALTIIECFKKAQLKAGERILIQTATGAVGLMAVQLAQSLGAIVYATAGSQKKLDYLASLGVPYCINYREEDFEAVIQQLTEGQGVDVVINMLAGEAIQKGLNCLAAGGRYVEIAMTALKLARSIDLSCLNNNQSVHSVDLRKLWLARPQALRDAWQEMEHLLEQGSIAPTLGKIFEFEEIHQAYRWMEDRQQIGKVVVRVGKRYCFKEPGFVTAKPLSDPIAIVGMSGRFARANSVQALWDALAQGQDLVEPVTRWELPEFDVLEDKSFCREGGFLRDIDCFDPLFFNISSMEALAMEPQQRLFMEEVWHALEDAGYAGRGVEGSRCGVYVGCSTGDYLNLLGPSAPAQAFWGNAASVIAARIAFHLDWQGPAIATDTACSSSLVALHQACEALRSGEVDMAIAGGVFVQCTDRLYRQGNRAGMLSNSGRCHAFDALADGFVPGEAVAAVVLKRLSEAQACGDTVYGVVQGSGINHDGATNGITAPSGPAQTRLEREVYRRFDIDPGNIQWVEAHGTGTVLGDPIEFNALTQAFSEPGKPLVQRAIGSIKSNIGHAATASGIAGVIKVLLSLQHRQIPASLHFSHSNPHIDFARSPFFVPTRLIEWEVAEGAERMAAVSSFGFSGTNAHVVLGEPPERLRPVSVRKAYLIVVSARSPVQLRTLVQRLVELVRSDEVIDMGAMSHTLLVGRRHHEHRLAFVVPNRAGLNEQMTLWLAGNRVADLTNDYSHRAADMQNAAVLLQGQQDLQTCTQEVSFETLNEALSRLSTLYKNHVDLPWECIFDTESRRRMRLPTYPFAQEKYWPSLPENVLLTASRTEPEMRTDIPPESVDSEVSVLEISQVVRDQFQRILLLTNEQLRDDLHFDRYGMDSIVRMRLVAALNSYFSLSLSSNVLSDYPTIEQLSVFISAERSTPALEPAPAADAPSEFVCLGGMNITHAELEQAWNKLLRPN